VLYHTYIKETTMTDIEMSDAPPEFGRNSNSKARKLNNGTKVPITETEKNCKALKKKKKKKKVSRL
jgi:hypothetical protein